MISKELVKILCCPVCKGSLEIENESFLVCKKCRVKYPVKDDIPVLLVEESQKIDEDR